MISFSFCSLCVEPHFSIWICSWFSGSSSSSSRSLYTHCSHTHERWFCLLLLHNISPNYSDHLSLLLCLSLTPVLLPNKTGSKLISNIFVCTLALCLCFSMKWNQWNLGNEKIRGIRRRAKCRVCDSIINAFSPPIAGKITKNANVSPITKLMANIFQNNINNSLLLLPTAASLALAMAKRCCWMWSKKKKEIPFLRFDERNT